MQREKMAKSVDGEVELRSLLAFGAVISGASAATEGWSAKMRLSMMKAGG